MGQVDHNTGRLDWAFEVVEDYFRLTTGHEGGLKLEDSLGVSID